MRRQQFFRVANVRLENGDEFALFSSPTLDDDGQRKHLLVKPDGSIELLSRITGIKTIFDAIQAIEPETEREDEPVQEQPLTERLGEWHYPDSSAVQRWRWYRDSVGVGRLVVVFPNGATYEYTDVPYPAALGMAAAPSIGRYLYMNIKGKYQSTRLTSDPQEVPF